MYKPSSGLEGSAECQLTVPAPGRLNRRAQERANHVISHLRAYPLAGDSVLLGRGVSCEMCGEVYRRGDWLRRLPCKHKVSKHVTVARSALSAVSGLLSLSAS